MSRVNAGLALAIATELPMILAAVIIVGPLMGAKYF
jgi:hypothetical protein